MHVPRLAKLLGLVLACLVLSDELGLRILLARSQPPPIGEKPSYYSPFSAPIKLLQTPHPQTFRADWIVGSGPCTVTYEVEEKGEIIFSKTMIARELALDPYIRILGARAPHPILCYEPGAGGWIYVYDGRRYVRAVAALTNPLSLWLRDPFPFLE